MEHLHVKTSDTPDSRQITKIARLPILLRFLQAVLVAKKDDILDMVINSPVPDTVKIVEGQSPTLCTGRTYTCANYFVAISFVVICLQDCQVYH